MNINELKENAELLKKRVIKTAWCGKEGHITSSLSMLDIANALYFGGILRHDSSNQYWKERDRFVLSKAHGALGHYVVLAEAGFFSKEKLKKYCHTGQELGDLGSMEVIGVENSGGSLGHGLAFAAGKAYAAKMKDENYLTYVLTGDGECQEGSIWEAALTIGRFKLNNLVWIIDCNGLQAKGRVENVMGLEPLAEKLEAFGFEVIDINGHDYNQLIPALSVDRNNLPVKPRVVIAHTLKGKGIPLFEDKEGWHGRRPTEQEYEVIIEQLGLTREEFDNL